jgi:hypothetical protein
MVLVLRERHVWWLVHDLLGMMRLQHGRRRLRRDRRRIRCADEYSRWAERRRLIHRERRAHQRFAATDSAHEPQTTNYDLFRVITRPQGVEMLRLPGS